MAGKLPTFVTGANAKIKLGGKTFAYCSDVSYRVAVDLIPIETMGRYEAVTLEPVNYTVSGELSVVRYTKVAGGASMPGTTANGNGLGNVDLGTGNKGSNQLDPGNLLTSKTWDLDVYQKTQAAATAGGAVAATAESEKIITIRDCRFNSKSAALNKRGILVDRLSFMGILADDESFDASNSGDTDFSA